MLSTHWFGVSVAGFVQPMLGRGAVLPPLPPLPPLPAPPPEPVPPFTDAPALPPEGAPLLLMPPLAEPDAPPVPALGVDVVPALALPPVAAGLPATVLFVPACAPVSSGSGSPNEQAPNAKTVAVAPSTSVARVVMVHQVRR